MKDAVSVTGWLTHRIFSQSLRTLLVAVAVSPSSGTLGNCLFRMPSSL